MLHKIVSSRKFLSCSIIFGHFDGWGDSTWPYLKCASQESHKNCLHFMNSLICTFWATRNTLLAKKGDNLFHRILYYRPSNYVKFDKDWKKNRGSGARDTIHQRWTVARSWIISAHSEMIGFRSLKLYQAWDKSGMCFFVIFLDHLLPECVLAAFIFLP